MNIVWLIDMGYVTKASKGRFKLDYIACKRFIEKKLNGKCKAIIFNSVDSYGVDIGLKQFYYTVKQNGFDVNLYEMEGGSQKQVDVAIGSHLVYHAMNKAHIVLSSGDIDFLPAIALAKDKIGAKITLFTFDFGVHDQLISSSDDNWYFEDYSQLMR